MKLFLITLAAGAFAAAPPRIELDLSAMDHVESLEESIYRTHNDGLTNGETAVTSRQDWTERCTAGADQGPSTCPFPIAKAWDHQDEDISDAIRTRVYRVDVDGHACGDKDVYDCGCDSDTDSQCKVTTVKFGERSTYLFKYDVTDQAGNHAEQVVFALILDDACDDSSTPPCKPEIAMCGTDVETWQAASTAKLCTGATATDNIDSPTVMASRLQYSIYKLDTEHPHASQLSTAISTKCEDASYAEYIAYRADPETYITTKPEPCGAKELKTSNPGRYLIKFTACDEAGVYGASSHNNCREERKTVVIVDTYAPVIHLNGYAPTYWQCHKRDRNHAACADGYSGTISFAPHAGSCTGAACCHKYQDAGATLSDSLDTQTNNDNISGQCPDGGPDEGCMKTTGHVDSSIVGNYTITYNGWDTHGNKADTRTRTVVIEDTRAPTATLNAAQGAIVEHYARTDHGQTETIVDEGAHCIDDCDTSTITANATWDRPFNDQELGSYVRTYTCEDAAGLQSSVTRTFKIVDKGQPTIHIMGDDELTLAASRTLEYTDEGATCDDYVDGTLSHAVEVSGQVVNMRIPGTYTINYDCQDLSGNAAEQKTRTVTIQDNDCPRITLVNPDQTHVYVEAGFDYNDAGATATDDLDGDLTDHITKSGDSVNTQQSFYSRRSCREIKQAYSGAQNAYYYITTYVPDEHATSGTGSFERRLVYCDMESTAVDGTAPGFTYFRCSGCKRVVPYQPAKIDPATSQPYQNDCPSFGMEMTVWDADRQNSKAYLEALDEDGDDDFSSYIPNELNVDSTSTNYLCSTNDATVAQAAGHEETAATVPHDKITRAEQGKYIIYYHVQDSSGNHECQPTPSRTVVVKDTLPPVITLHLAKAGSHVMIHSSDPGTSSAETGSVANPAGTFAGGNIHLGPDYQPKSEDTVGNSFMAEEQQVASSTGWLVAGAGAAIAGIAMLALSRRQDQVITVDV